MPRPRKHPLASSSNPAAPAAPAADDAGAPAPGDPESFALAVGNEFTADVAMVHLTRRTDGWLRVVPHDDGYVVYYKWKFTSARWPNHYVMYRCVGEHPRQALWGLLQKIDECYRGARKPVYDTPYNLL